MIVEKLNTAFSRNQLLSFKLAIFEPDAQNETDTLFNASLDNFISYLRILSAPRNSEGDDLFMSAGYVESTIPTAFASKLNNFHLIGMHTSLAVVIQEFALFCFTQQNFFPEIGDASSEISPKPLDGVVPGLWLMDRTVKGLDIPKTASRIVPRDAVRHAYAVYLALMMMRFAWFHELGHCILGHVDFLNKKTDALGLTEIGLSKRSHRPTTTIEPSLRQTFEFEADCYSLSMCLRMQTHDAELIEGIATMPKQLRIYLALFAAYSMAWLFEVIEKKYLKHTIGEYPEPYRRFRLLVQMAVWEGANETPDFLNHQEIVLHTLRDLTIHMGEEWSGDDNFNADAFRKRFDQARTELTPFRYVVPD